MHGFLLCFSGPPAHPLLQALQASPCWACMPGRWPGPRAGRWAAVFSGRPAQSAQCSPMYEKEAFHLTADCHGVFPVGLELCGVLASLTETQRSGHMCSNRLLPALTAHPPCPPSLAAVGRVVPAGHHAGAAAAGGGQEPGVRSAGKRAGERAGGRAGGPDGWVCVGAGGWVDGWGGRVGGRAGEWLGGRAGGWVWWVRWVRAGR